MVQPAILDKRDAIAKTPILERIAAMKETLAAAGEEAQRLRHLPAWASREMADQGLYRFVLPLELGGENLRAKDYFSLCFAPQNFLCALALDGVFDRFPSLRGGVKGGTVVGATDEFGFKAEDKPVHVHDLHATILHLLGFDHTQLTFRHAGRDFRLTDVHGNVVHDLVA